MLTEAEYNGLWNIHFLPIIGINYDNYADYCERESYFQDYLDLFRGIDTRLAGTRFLSDGFILNCTNDHTYTEVEINTKRKIRYVLIAEAATENYFYNHNAPITGYFSAPYIALVNPANIGANNPENKRQRLIEFANAGVLLLDLFPFAITYTPILRNSLNIAGVTLNFFNNLGNIYSIENRILSLQNESLFEVGFNKNYPNACLIAPPKISHFLAQNVNVFPITFLNFKMGFNELLAPNLLPLNPILLYINVIANPNAIIGLIAHYHFNLHRCPTFGCCAYSGAGFVPHELFIRSSLEI